MRTGLILGFVFCTGGTGPAPIQAPFLLLQSSFLPKLMQFQDFYTIGVVVTND